MSETGATSVKLKVLDLFSGIGGFSLGLERTGGFETIAFCEIDNYCQRVLKKHWPEVYIHSDIRTLTARHFDGYRRPDVLCGGFPCQDISIAGRKAGISGSRSGLWKEYWRLTRELAPGFVIIENVAALLGNGMDVVLRDLSEIGYDAEWQVISASAFGAPHVRERVWILAYPGCARLHERGQHFDVGEEVRDLRGNGRHGVSREPGIQGQILDTWKSPIKPRPWMPESGLARVANGIPNRPQRIKGLGNAVVPVIPEWIGTRILATELESQENKAGEL